MTKTWNEYEMTPEHVEQCKRVEQALCNEINLQAREGVPVAILLSAIGMTAADLLTCQSGPASVPLWFEKQAALIRSLQAPH